jgi:hypothetical protein
MTMRKVSCDGKLTDRWRSLAKLLDRVLPNEKVDEWGWNPTRKEWAATKRHAAEKNAAEERRKPRRIPVLRAGGGRRNSKRTECLRFKRKT